jgi:hypothetical protein
MTDELRDLLRAEVHDLVLPPGTAATVLAAHSRRTRRRRVLLTGTALAVVAASTAVAVLVPRDGDPDRLAPVARSGDRVVRDGDRVTATGTVVQVPGAPPRLCAPVPMPAILRGPEIELCELGVDLEGVDLAGLAERREHEGAVTGSATVTGVYRREASGTASGTVAVESQEQPRDQGQAAPEQPDAPPCPAPDGGWPRDPAILRGPGSTPEGDANMDRERPALDAYRAEHPEQFVQVALLRPFPDSVLLGVIATDGAARDAVERGLRPTYGERLCVVVTRYAPEEIAAAREAISPTNEAMRAEGVHSGGGIGVSDDLQVVVRAQAVVLTEALRAAVDRHPAGLVEVETWLVHAG